MENNYKFKTIGEFRKAHPFEYATLRKNGWLEQFINELGWFMKKTYPKGHWDIKENVLNEALKFTNKTKWMTKSQSSYKNAVKNGWLEECIAHMEVLNKPSGFWKDKQNCLESAKQFKTIKEWSSTHYGAWENAKKYGWFDECTAHMTSLKVTSLFWRDKQNCLDSARQFSTIKEWSKTNYGAWENAKKYGWFDECIAHMEKNYIATSFWTKEKCIEEALKHKTRNEWLLACFRSHKAAGKNDWMDECTAHMITHKIPTSFWTKERCIEYASKCESKIEWRKHSIGAYKAAKTNGWMEECTAHMIDKRKKTNK
jgi:hypothetical protein